MGYSVQAKDGDVVSFLKGQHKQIEALFKDVVESAGTEREDRFHELCRLLTIHEAGEEAVVHPAASLALKDGAAEVAERLGEETEAREAIAELKLLDTSSDEFNSKIRELETNVLAHASREERQELNKLAGSIDAERLMRMRKAVEVAEACADDDADDTDPHIYERVTPVDPRRQSPPSS
jgi:hemerythrin superfamily protein